jgi:hypothetical protein
VESVSKPRTYHCITDLRMVLVEKNVALEFAEAWETWRTGRSSRE